MAEIYFKRNQSKKNRPKVINYKRIKNKTNNVQWEEVELVLISLKQICKWSKLSCDVVPQACCPRWCRCSQARWTAGRLCRSVWPKPSVKSSTDSWTTAWMRKPWHRWFLKSARHVPTPRTPCCTIGPCRSASASVVHVKRLSVSECTGPCASHKVRNPCVCHYMHMYVYGCVGVYMCMNASLGMNVCVRGNVVMGNM